ncbi:hypothetical protein ABL78_1150 [Leptomonas seymouri]|uniref:SAM domain-containing protein n=1 Tax=Leptomonas seymouri TaxID=5684 RepID=A0A0N1PDH5_LEPSE|nr:hypothetical protein ABL78_1150 [Leptomonas seymouri]|eukprot:KPI89770.1 hypothetical protein ABL78_1150 [Leptomonas seymouri]
MNNVSMRIEFNAQKQEESTLEMLRASWARRAASKTSSNADPGATKQFIKTLQETVASVLLLPRYLRHAPPRLYVTCTPDHRNAPHACGRHMTKVMDVSRAVSLDAPPHTQSVYLLTTTSMDDVEFKDTAAQSRVLVGLPQVRHVDAVHRFCDTHGSALENIHHVLLPGDITLTQSLLIKTLLDHLPQARLVCNEFGHALLTNPVFHDGVQRAMLENAPGTPLELMRFAGLPASRVSPAQDGDEIAVDVPQSGNGSSAAASPARKLRVVAVKNNAQEKRRKANSQTHQPSYFTNQPLFLYDEVFHALFVGHTLHRLPWLTSVVKEATRELLLPMPPSLALQHPMSRPSSLLDSWRIEETSSAVVAALRCASEVERVLSNSYGELSGNIEDCIAELEKSTDALERLRSRLAQRLASDTSRDVHRWSTALLKRIVQELTCIQKVSEPTTPAVQEQFISWAQNDGEWGRLATCLTHSAMVLPPTVAPAVTSTVAGSSASGNDGAGSSTSSAGTSAASSVASSEGKEAARPLQGTSGVDLLVAVFEKKGLQGLTRTVQRETIDVQVFLAMSENDLKTVFKATFGITKRLSLLQDELRKNL